MNLELDHTLCSGSAGSFTPYLAMQLKWHEIYSTTYRLDSRIIDEHSLR